ncbi:hypothetical protein CC2G_002140 [Coprinopsis cinerea AmutBmut pab1-1]|nr:hypothetical protein CC2G_002140 [Coprinopsis cinerea AmutBmut pab1-1]
MIHSRAGRARLVAPNLDALSLLNPATTSPTQTHTMYQSRTSHRTSRGMIQTSDGKYLKRSTTAHLYRPGTIQPTFSGSHYASYPPSAAPSPTASLPRASPSSSYTPERGYDGYSTASSRSSQRHHTMSTVSLSAASSLGFVPPIYSSFRGSRHDSYSYAGSSRSSEGRRHGADYNFTTPPSSKSAVSSTSSRSSQRHRDRAISTFSGSASASPLGLVPPIQSSSRGSVRDWYSSANGGGLHRRRREPEYGGSVTLRSFSASSSSSSSDSEGGHDEDSWYMGSNDLGWSMAPPIPGWLPAVPVFVPVPIPVLCSRQCATVNRECGGASPTVVVINNNHCCGC